MKYRPEIDGVRALAVIMVVLFHAGFESFSGGYVGVDIFFVVSGYLITTIILTEMEEGTFSLIHFYERRARRILPALFFVMFASLLMAWIWFLPSEMKQFSEGLIAVSTFSSNLFFWSESGYWDTANEMKPLLHTWSLAVEEQYYILFPLFLIVMWRYRMPWVVGCFSILALISLFLAQWGAYNHPSATFYLLPTRGWELAIGASIAFYLTSRKPVLNKLFSHKLIGEIFSFVGLLMIGYTVYVYDENVPFPSFYALLPTIGAGFIIIFSSQQNFIGKMLGSKPIGRIGLISYSAYLWHYPIFVFARHMTFDDLTTFALIGLIVLAFLVGYISWKFVENPFRQKGRVSRSRVFVFSGIGSLVFVVFGILGIYTQGFQGREMASGAEVLDYGQHWNGWESCDLVRAASAENGGCYVLARNQPIEALVIGDSHAGHLATGLRELYLEKGVNVAVMLHAGCYPFYSITYQGALKFQCSSNLIRNALDYAITTDSVKTVILSGYPSLVIHESRFHQEGVLNDREIASNVTAFELGLRKTLSALIDANKRVIFIQDNPELLKNPETCFKLGYPPECDRINITKEEYLTRNFEFLSIVDLSAQKFDGVTFVSAASTFCDDEQCYGYKDGVLLYATRDHLTPAGSRFFISSIESILLPLSVK